MSDEERGALILRIAVQLMRRGVARGWSDALKLAREELEGAR